MSNNIYSHHYTYEIKNKKGLYYIGVRSCNCNPSDDIYMGSSKILRDAISISIETLLC